MAALWTAALAAVTLAKEETLEAAQDGETHQEEQQQEQEELTKQDSFHTTKRMMDERQKRIAQKGCAILFYG